MYVASIREYLAASSHSVTFCSRAMLGEDVQQGVVQTATEDVITTMNKTVKEECESDASTREYSCKLKTKKKKGLEPEKEKEEKELEVEDTEAMFWTLRNFQTFLFNITRVHAKYYL